MLDNGFREKVCMIVAQIPEGRVMTYGDVAAFCGSPFAARQVGQIAHFGPSELPWQRIVNRNGGLASAYSFGGLEGQKAALEADGIEVDNNFRVIGFKVKRWHPTEQQTSLLL
ncbi:MAG TPA: MGMT family protein [Candidatus Saccharimonadales bacterium]